MKFVETRKKGEPPELTKDIENYLKENKAPYWGNTAAWLKGYQLGMIDGSIGLIRFLLDEEHIYSARGFLVEPYHGYKIWKILQNIDFNDVPLRETNDGRFIINTVRRVFERQEDGRMVNGEYCVFAKKPNAT